jgi:hypothetical protein
MVETESITTGTKKIDNPSLASGWARSTSCKRRVIVCEGLDPITLKKVGKQLK